jgi:primosomal protein N' (replication factor Y)
LGTQKLEDEIKRLFPSARILRMDQDTTSKKGSYQNIIDAFSNFEYDILLGTQMISKGLDFKNVTLVGIINADTSLNIPDFRANEKTFDLLYQTSGRAGRFNKKGDVLIQTFNADNDTLKFVKDNDYEGFFVYEMNIRHNLKYPPYTFIATINVKSKSYDEASINANKIQRFIRENIDKKSSVYGPTPASVFKVNNVYNFQIIIKYTSDNKLHNILKQLDESYITNNLVNIEISFNPSHF